MVEQHDGEGVFPLFKKGTRLENLQPCENYKHWWACSINGTETYLPDVYINEGILNKDYNPTELVIAKDETVVLLEVLFEWLYVKNKKEECGWVPAAKAVSI